MGDSHLEDETYFDSPEPRERGSFDVALLNEPVSVLRAHKPVVFSATATVTDAAHAMKRGHCGCVVVTEDGTADSKVVGIFTERDVLFRIVDQGRDPTRLLLAEVMTPEPETLSLRSSVAYALNKMCVGGFRHIPIVDDARRPSFVVSVRDVVEFLVESFPREVLNLPPVEGVRPQRSREGA